MKDAGKFDSPNFVFTCHCQSVIGQYPIPNHIPNKNHEAAVASMQMKCALRVAGHIHPKRLKPIKTKCAIVNKISSNCNMR